MNRRRIQIIAAGAAIVIISAAVQIPAQHTRAIKPKTTSVTSTSKSSKTIPEFQRDPARLVKEFYLNAKTSRSPFDPTLTAENVLGGGRWEKLTEKQRSTVTKAVGETVNSILIDWDPKDIEQVRVLKSEVKDNRAVMVVLRELDLIRLTLSNRNGAWFIVEHEVMDDAFPELADAVNGALNPNTARGSVNEMPNEAALTYVDNLITKEGESPELLLLKYRVLVSQKVDDAQARRAEALRLALTGKSPNSEASRNNTTDTTSKNNSVDNRSIDLLQRITQKWPNFAAGYLASAFDLLYYRNDEAILSSLSQDAEKAIDPLKKYAELMPYDPRPWRDLAHAYTLLERYDEAETAFDAAIERDPTYLDHYAALVGFYLTIDEPQKSNAAFSRLLKVAPSSDDAFFALESDDDEMDADYAILLEKLLQSYPKELNSSSSGLVILAQSLEAQNKITEAIKTMNSAIAIKAEADDYEFLSSLYRQQQRYTEALNSANQAVKLDASLHSAYFERACSLTQLNKKREALSALKQMLSIAPDAFFDPEEPDLQPLANMPEYAAIKEKLKSNFSKE